VALILLFFIIGSVFLFFATKHKPLHGPGTILQRYDEFDDPYYEPIVIKKVNDKYYKFSYLHSTTTHVLSCDWIDRNYRKID